jgi:hypothetical protein
MTGGQKLDGERGALPEIRTTIWDITFIMAPPGAPHGDQLVIRCDADGGVWAAIQAPQSDADG